MSQYCDNFKFSENNQDHFVMGPVSNDTFQFWQGLRGPYFTPSVDEDGVLSWTNNGQLPNPEPVRIVGKDGRGITLTGQCETVADLPEDPEQGEAWAVGEAEPFECYAWFGEWVDMGLLFPAGQDGVSPTVTISATATGHKVKITDRDHPSGQEFNVDDGDPGQDGISPAVTITTTATGHKVKITDRDHPSGQEFNVDDGEDGDPGPGVPAGGSAGQFYRKASGTDYDGEWHTLSAGDSSYDSSLTYPSGTVGQELSSQRNTLGQLETNVGKILPVITGSTNNSGYTINTGDYFEANGSLYKANASIPINGAWSSSATAQASTAVNDLKDSFKSDIANLPIYPTNGNGVKIGKQGTLTVYRYFAYSDGTGARTFNTGIPNSNMINAQFCLRYNTYFTTPYYTSSTDYWNCYVQNGVVTFRGAGGAITQASRLYIIIDYVVA